MSRVLNNSKHVSEELKERVLSVVEETNFKPNLLARGLVNKKTNLIGVLIPRISNNFFSQLIEGINEVAENYGYNILLSTSYNNLQKELEYLNIFVDRQLDGIILAVTDFSDQHKSFFEKTTIPTVFMGQQLDKGKYPYVTIDNVKASCEATRFLINQKHQKIAILAGPDFDIATGDNRLQGYLEALKEANLPINPRWQTRRYHTIEDGYQAAAQIMSQQERPTAIFACSDQQALGAINYLHEHGYDVPGDISVVGFDDIDLASVFKPKLTTIKQNPVDIGTTAARLLIDQIKERPIPFKGNYIPFRLVVRESTKSWNDVEKPNYNQ